MSTQPNRSEQVTDEERRILEERLNTFDEDTRSAEPWEVVRDRILQNLKSAMSH